MPAITTATDLAARLRGTVALAGEPGYEAATPFNVAVPVRPHAVVAVACAADVVETVRHAGDHGLRVAVQRTGHGAVAVDGDDVLLVHTGGLDGIEIDGRIARVGAGVTFQMLLDAAAPHGLAPSMGSAPGVGVVGFLTGGGIGPLVRAHGVGSDRVRAFELVTGDGQWLRVSADEHPDLFWALRGGKGTVGVVCAVELELFEQPTIHGGALYFAEADIPAVLHHWREWAPALPEHASTSVAILQLPPLPGIPAPLAGRMTVAVRFASVSDDDAECVALLGSLRELATPVIDAVDRMPYAAIGAIHADPPDPMPVAEASGLLRELPAGAVDALLAHAGPRSGSPQVVVEVRQLGGAFAREPEHGDAFCHREAAFSVMAIGVLAPEIAAIVPRHGAGVVAALDPWSTGGLLPNFAASTDPARMARAYDEDTRTWLAALADRHDPRGVLRVGNVVR